MRDSQRSADIVERPVLRKPVIEQHQLHIAPSTRLEGSHIGGGRGAEGLQPGPQHLPAAGGRGERMGRWEGGRSWGANS